MTLTQWIDYLLVVNKDMEPESNQRLINQWLESELLVRGFSYDDIRAEFVRRGW